MLLKPSRQGRRIEHFSAFIEQYDDIVGLEPRKDAARLVVAGCEAFAAAVWQKRPFQIPGASQALRIAFDAVSNPGFVLLADGEDANHRIEVYQRYLPAFHHQGMNPHREDVYTLVRLKKGIFLRGRGLTLLILLSSHQLVLFQGIFP